MSQTRESTMSGLRYHGTDDDVRLGDRVEVRRFLSAARRGTITYIPSKTARELQAAGEEADEWVVTIGATSYSILYSPEDLQPPPTIRLISRGPVDFKSLSPGELERLEISPPPSARSFLGCLFTAALIGLAISAVVAGVRLFGS